MASKRADTLVAVTEPIPNALVLLLAVLARQGTPQEPVNVEIDPMVLRFRGSDAPNYFHTHRTR